ncbi:DNA internalization-related competence protein ComEC/Rec2 [uncultured Methylibium sp.]|uniref:DNA internalization-related competence protein ComEC/Rec2 n=1 Tax=uncultured Methylibium sp. TaxID=381093 RepID=UPI0025D1BFA4|nr:DNA internalization-related competence protein ComEC/Rec2 [uncultured Methylibium sp.]
MRGTAATAGTTGLAAGLGWVLGAALQLQQGALWPVPGYAALVGAGVLGLALVLAGRRRGAAALIVLVAACAACAFGSTGWRAGARLAAPLAPELEGRDLAVVGVVASLPQRSPEAWRFRFEVESARLGDTPIALPPRLSLGWYASGTEALPALRAGQRWQLTLRLKRPHGLANPQGFDYELHLFEQGVRATGYVRAARPGAHRLLGDDAGHAVDRARQTVRDAIAARVPDASAAGVLAALAVGDQAAIEREDWALYRATGVAHLMSISGLHVTMFAWLAGLGLGALWRRSAWLMLRCPAPLAARWGGLAAAAAYAVFAGWGVPAQRTLLMLATVTVVGAAGLRWSWPLVWGSAMVVVTAIDPWALLQPGFWLSFVAVGLLMASGEARALVGASSGLDAVADRPRWREWLAGLGPLLGGALRTQVVATLGLAPLTLVFFQQLSLVGFAANLAAIPVVTLLVTPLALLGAVLPVLWSAGAWIVAALNAGLQVLAAPAWSSWTVPAAAPWAVASGLLGAAVALLPLPWRVRALALPLLLPLLWPQVPRPPEGAFELTAVDVGQGTAVLLRTARHTLLYDAGPQYSRETDAGERVLLPLLRALGERRIDTLMLSHRDTDHVGGAAALLRGLPVARLSGSLERAHPLLALARQQGVPVDACAAGQRWDWDGVSFELLHPPAAMLDRAEHERIKPNTLSCVLRVVGRWGGIERRVLLTGDLEREQELRLATLPPAALASDVLLVPHHGSKTSSSAALLDAVAPRVAVLQAGYRNRFGHPAAEVMARLRERGIAVIDSPRCGAWRHGPDGSTCWRETRRRYWQHTDRPDNGVEVAIPAESEPSD